MSSSGYDYSFSSASMKKKKKRSLKQTRVNAGNAASDSSSTSTGNASLNASSNFLAPVKPSTANEESKSAPKRQTVQKLRSASNKTPPLPPSLVISSSSSLSSQSSLTHTSSLGKDTKPIKTTTQTRTGRETRPAPGNSQNARRKEDTANKDGSMNSTQLARGMGRGTPINEKDKLQVSESSLTQTSASITREFTNYGSRPKPLLSHFNDVGSGSGSIPGNAASSRQSATSSSFDSSTLEPSESEDDGSDSSEAFLQQAALGRTSPSAPRPTSTALPPSKRYDKYRKYLTSPAMVQGKEWVVPKTKIGAPPELEYTYRYSGTGNGSREVVTSPMSSSTVSSLSSRGRKQKLQAQAKVGTPLPKSDKFSRDDMKTLNFMLGDDSYKTEDDITFRDEEDAESEFSSPAVMPKRLSASAKAIPSAPIIHQLDSTTSSSLTSGDTNKTEELAMYVDGDIASQASEARASGERFVSPQHKQKPQSIMASLANRQDGASQGASPRHESKSSEGDSPLTSRSVKQRANKVSMDGKIAPVTSSKKDVPKTIERQPLARPDDDRNTSQISESADSSEPIVSPQKTRPKKKSTKSSPRKKKLSPQPENAPTEAEKNNPPPPPEDVISARSDSIGKKNRDSRNEHPQNAKTAATPRSSNKHSGNKGSKSASQPPPPDDDSVASYSVASSADGEQEAMAIDTTKEPGHPSKRPVRAGNDSGVSFASSKTGIEDGARDNRRIKGLPPVVLEDEEEDEIRWDSPKSKRLGASTRTTRTDERSQNTTDDDFSTLWAQSVAEESLAMGKSYRTQDSADTLGDKKSEQRPSARKRVPEQRSNHSRRPSYGGQSVTSIYTDGISSKWRVDDTSSSDESKTGLSEGVNRASGSSRPKPKSSDHHASDTRKQLVADYSSGSESSESLRLVQVVEGKGYNSAKSKKNDKANSKSPARETETLASTSSADNAIKRPDEQGMDDSLNALDFGEASIKNGEDDGSLAEFSLLHAEDLDVSSSKFDIPEYEPKRSSPKTYPELGDTDLNQGFQSLNLDDVEAPVKDSSSKKKKKKTKTNKFEEPGFGSSLWRHFARGSALLFLLAAIGLPIYFLVYYDSDQTTGNAMPIGGLFPIEPTSIPTPAPILIAPPTPITPPTLPTAPTPIAQPSRQPVPPTVSPVQPTPRPVQPTSFPVPSPTTPPFTPIPTGSPVLVATPVPTTLPGTIESLRAFLISRWPSLETSLIGFSSPQYRALEWLANDPNVGTYTDMRLIQRFVLVSLYFSTDGDNWRNNNLWLSTQDECIWYSGAPGGLPCDSSGSLVRLELDLNDLMGTIPGELALLSNSLTHIDLSRSSSSVFLSGSMPSELGLLSNLESVNLRGNRLTGSLPFEIGNWQRLETLDLGVNRFESEVPSSIGNLVNLFKLDLSDNRLDGTLPVNIGALTNTRTLDLQSNRFTGGIPSNLGDLRRIQTLNMLGNRFTSVPTEIGRLILVRSIALQNNDIQGTLPSEIGSLGNLVSLNLANNAFSGTIPTQIGNLFVIRDLLDVSNNQLIGSLPAELGNLIFLRNLLFHSNLLTGSIPPEFSSLRRLNALRLESNSLVGTVPDEVCEVYESTYPVFVTDCTVPEIECPCCMFCCQDNGQCDCQFVGTGLEFLCSEFERSPGLSNRLGANYGKLLWDNEFENR